MSAQVRWIAYSTASIGSTSTGGTSGLGTRGYSQSSSIGDNFSIGSSNNLLYLNIDSTGTQYITLTSGSDLDPRCIARDITEKMHASGYGGGWSYGQCRWDNNTFKITSGSLSASSSIVVASGTNTAHVSLGWIGAGAQAAGNSSTNAGNYTVSVSGTYYGFLDDMYKVVINSVQTVGTPTKDGANTATATITAGGSFNPQTGTPGATLTYTIGISVDGRGTTMGGGTGNVPIMTWTGSGGGLTDNSSSYVELLYPNYWYSVGSYGLKVKFTDGIFMTDSSAWSVPCTISHYAFGSSTIGSIGQAKYIYSSTRGDNSIAPILTASGSGNTLGSRGLYLTFSGTGNFTAGDEFYVICQGPAPSAYDITNLNYGNVTVSSESSTQCVVFEVMSGAVELSTVKFGLQSDGTFQHHNKNNNDTFFRFGTVGPGNTAGGAGNTYEWYSNVSNVSMNSVTDIPPSYLYAVNHNLAVVTTADASQSIGYSAYSGMLSDPIFLGIKLGSSEVGSNSSINHRLFYDYS